MEPGRYVKTTSEGNTFALDLREDGTLREWWHGGAEPEGWGGTWARTSPSPGRGRFLVRIGPWRTEYGWQDGHWTGIELDDDDREHCTSTVLAENVHAGFAQLLDRARDVAGELRDAGVPGHVYESQKPGGELLAAFAPVDGWIVAGLDISDTYRGELSGSLRRSSYESHRDEVWLHVDGRLSSVSLRNETVRGGGPGGGANVAPTQVEVRDLTVEAAQRWDRRHTWKSRDTRERGQVVHEEWRVFLDAGTPPCATLASALDELRGLGR